MFDTAVRKILQYAQSLTIFDGPKDTKLDVDVKCKGDSLLIARAARRNAVYYEANANIQVPCDRRYDSRDSPDIADHDSDGIEALKVSRLVYAWPGGLTHHLESSELLKTFKGWGRMSGPIPMVSLVYTKEWLRLDLPAKWLSIYNFCRQIGPPASKKFELLFSFAALAYSAPDLRKFIRVLLACATIHGSLLVAPPPHLSYNLTEGFEPLRKQVRSMIVAGTYDLANNPARPLQRLDETLSDFRSRQAVHNEDILRRTDDATDRLIEQWRSLQSPFHSDDPSWFNTDKIMSNVTEYFSSCSRNAELLLFTSQVTAILQANCVIVATPLTGEQISKFRFVPRFDTSHASYDPHFALANLLSCRTENVNARSTRETGIGASINPRPLGQPIDTSILENLISQFRSKRHSKLTQLYSERLERSRRELQGLQTLTLPNHLPPIQTCLAFRDECKSRLHNLFATIRSALEPSTITETILADAGLWPRIHHFSMLHTLASAANFHLSPEWTESLATFAKAFIEYQHSQRLLGYALQSDTEKFFKELDSASFNWREVGRNPDWLLIQVGMIFL
jgi:hypothetical protein